MVTIPREFLHETLLPVPSLPAVPSDLKPSVPHGMRLRARNFRAQMEWSGEYRHRGQEFLTTLKADRQALFDILSEEQYATLYHYGYAEERGSQGGRFRVHYERGNNVSEFRSGNYVDIGWCCYLRDAITHDVNILSNLLALRTNENAFTQRACDTRPYEWYDDNEYRLRHNADRDF